MEEVPIFDGEESGKKKNKKKCKRERIEQTQCKAKMLVKLKDGRWEVTHFVRDHNHPLVAKPSLSNYLQSHMGISPEEKRFLEILHNCNLTSGRMMTIMSEFYVSELNVPYGPKAITNLCVGFSKD
ncbi:protein FAR1-RELATED SEQUENCE 5-like [Triticum aestivum]|uniref:protein FAR1-RELATED SEQUENCE 5-like n=1 Tax=Triticum aestivum TaxID=4565 RepID=UPI001D004CF6|nr:protein FAR1-RELATED SEQUENCE 5-like [Triticum aestivum]